MPYPCGRILQLVQVCPSRVSDICVDVLSYSACKTRYYPNYYVNEHHSIRTYYPGVPQVIQVSMHHYVEESLAQQCMNLMVCAWYGDRSFYLGGTHDFEGYQERTWPESITLTLKNRNLESHHFSGPTTSD